jgi:hypothetical protein
MSRVNRVIKERLIKCGTHHSRCFRNAGYLQGARKPADKTIFRLDDVNRMQVGNLLPLLKGDNQGLI